MGKPTGFLEYDRKENACIQPLDRIKNFNEFHTVLNEEQRRLQGARCMNCGVPFCQSAMELSGKVTGCPLHNLIPEWNDEIYNGNYQHALARLLKTNPFPEFTGRVCPALCEKACINGVHDDPVTCHDNELFIIETAYANNWMKPNIPIIRSDKKVAVIGAGPSGLACAHDLNKRGHHVTVYERDNRAGGLLMYGIPNMKLDKQYIKRRIDILEQEGITFKYNMNVGVDITKEDLLKEYDAIVLCVGSKQPRDLNGQGRDTKGIYFAVDYLTQATKNLLDDTKCISAKDKHVVIVGGGDTGNDCVGTAIRQGCKSVTQIEMMPKAPDTRLESNPWPEWPNICKTDYGQQESIALFKKDPRIYESTITEFILKKDKLTAVKVGKVTFKDRKLSIVEDSQTTIPCDLLLIAAGFTGIESYVKDSFGLETSPRNTILTSANSYHTKQDKIFTAGDAHRGQSLVVWAIHEGKDAAREVDEYLMQYTNIE
ncbi:MAG: glutamate synthase subunit beta [Holdemanella sp.]|nr:glutamate synthase subunit beta [Holdemanella sp.]